jgi:hypothetical protein
LIGLPEFCEEFINSRVSHIKCSPVADTSFIGVHFVKLELGMIGLEEERQAKTKVYKFKI